MHPISRWHYQGKETSATHLNRAISLRGPPIPHPTSKTYFKKKKRGQANASTLLNKADLLLVSQYSVEEVKPSVQVSGQVAKQESAHVAWCSHGETPLWIWNKNVLFFISLISSGSSTKYAGRTSIKM